ncbi:MAG: hypothetical protein ACLFUI_04760 [Halanaerobiales bacterium]
MDNQIKQRVKTIKYGGIKYINNVPTEQISDFVDKLPDDKRSSMAEVTQILKEEGLISLIPDDEPSPPC